MDSHTMDSKRPISTQGIEIYSNIFKTLSKFEEEETSQICLGFGRNPTV